MNVKKITSLILIVVFVCLAAGVTTFAYNAMHSYKINSGFVSLPLQFDPEDSSSAYKLNHSKVTVYGGFIKGIQNNKKNSNGSLVIRALSPLPNINVKSDSENTVVLLLENVNPDFYAKRISGSKQQKEKNTANTLQISVKTKAGKTIKIEPIEPKTEKGTEGYQYIILGDNRNGYDTFREMIRQVNAKNPVFVIDNGDLVFSGKPNQYRLFDQMTSNISATLCTTLGNHDIRGNGRITYTSLYGPAYYSFDFADSHFVFLDSSPGWVEKQAISDEQYVWLQNDLKKAEGKHIYVITHIPPYDPRRGVTPNEIPNYVNDIKNSGGWWEQKLNNYNVSKSMDHGFQDPLETARFENLMNLYQVDTVYLSHIHSYIEYTKNDVSYLISGGAGAELLTENSYYHYIIRNIDDGSGITIVELPSPTNTYLVRYGTAVKIFVIAMYDENQATVVFGLVSFVLLILLLLGRIYVRGKLFFHKIAGWLRDTAKYAAKRYNELFFKKTL